MVSEEYNDEVEIDSTVSSSTDDVGPQSAQQEIIMGLQRVENALAQLLHIAADAIDASILNLGANQSEQSDPSASDSAAAADPEQFQRISAAYVQLLDKIQLGLRNSFHSLTRSGLLLHSQNALAASTSGQLQVPYTALQSTQQLEFELLTMTRLSQLILNRLSSE